MNGAKWAVAFHPVNRDHEQLIEETARGMRMWRMIMMEECRLRLFGKSVSGRRGGLCGRRGGGGIAPDSAGATVVPADRSWAAAAHGGVMLRCLDMSKTTRMPAGARAQNTTVDPTKVKGAKQSHRETRNLNSAVSPTIRRTASWPGAGRARHLAKAMAKRAERSRINIVATACRVRT
jgi:hypothetical protein